MTASARRHPPRVFLSFAGPDRPIARRLSRDLQDRGVDTFLDLCSSDPGDNVPLRVSQELSASDYYLLLWSQHSVDRDWVTAEWTAAFTRELLERRSFLFIARLDTTPLPTLLAPRRYLDAFSDWTGCVDDLSTLWRSDQGTGTAVFPAPRPDPAASDGALAQQPMHEIYVRNHALSMSSVLTVPAVTTGTELWDRVRSALDLREHISMFGDQVGMRFGYELRLGSDRVPLDRTEPLRLPAGATVDLIVEIAVNSRTESLSRWVWRRTDPGPGDAGGPQTPGVSAKIQRALLNAAFGHLMPD